MNRSEKSIAAIILVIIVIIPYMSDTALNLLDHQMFRVLMIVVLLLAIQNSVFAGVGVLLIIGVALIQRNSRKLPGVTSGPVPRMVEDAEMPLSPSIEMPVASTPSDDMIYFAPQEDSGSNEVNGEASGFDEKFLPASAPNGAAAGAIWA